MELNNEKVFLNDRVFDVSHSRGYGTVSRITETYIEVKFSRSSIRYDSEGIQIGKHWQTLFWDKPLIIKPMKQDDHWSMKMKMIDDFYKLMENYKGLF